MTNATLSAILNDTALLLSLEPEELGGFILCHLNQSNPTSHEFVADNLALVKNLGDFDVADREDVSLALTEAWQWLEREGLIVKRPYSKQYIITRRGRRLKSVADVTTFRAAKSIPRDLLHPRLLGRVWPAVLRVDYETAIFQAFREVEIAVRETAHFAPTDLGVPLMRKAFDKSSGPLTDLSEPEAEREALSHLFSGSIGRFKNPTSHRAVAYTLTEATEALILASSLLRIVESRADAGG